jgi:MFS family permease
MNPSALNSTEKKVSLSLALVFGLRMLGLFMILPVFAIYGVELEGYSPMWLGLAIGAYGLTQALLQIPMGLLSDKIGRKPVIIGGLVIFALGSVVAALADSVYGVVLGRALQGTGAIASAILALAADLSREEQRPKVMATIGMFIGLSFALAMVLGPVISASFGLSGLFWLTAILAFLSIFLIQFVVPNAVNKSPKGDNIVTWGKFGKMLKNDQLLRLDFGVFILHLILTAMFVTLPQMLINTGFAAKDHWQLYFPALIGSFFIMVPFMIVAMKKKKENLMFSVAIMLMTLSCLLLWRLSDNFSAIVVMVVLFFIGFNYLEATMPSILSRIAPAGAKGTAMGIFSTSQFFGAFIGGVFGGFIQSHWGSENIFLACACLLLPWLLLSLGMKKLKKSKSFSFTIDLDSEEQAEHIAKQLALLPGVVEATLVQSEAVAYLKVDEKTVDFAKVKAVLAGS